MHVRFVGLEAHRVPCNCDTVLLITVSDSERGEAGLGQAHLVDLVPAVFVLAADGGLFVQQQLAAVGVSPHHGGVVERCQTPAVLVVWRGSQLQQRL